MAETTTKLLIGSLLAGAAMLTGDVTLLATAGGIGVNWASEALPQLANQQLNSGSPLAQAGSSALRKALSDLEKQFRTSVNPNTERRSFRLLRETTGAVLDPAYPPGAANLADLQTTIATSLDDLLHGHDAQEVAFLRTHLLPALVRRFREELDSNDAAWRAFHGRLIEQLHARAAQPNPPADLTPLITRLDNQQQALDALRDGDSALEQCLAHMKELITRLEQGQKPQPAAVSFHNQDVRVRGNLNQAGGNIYQNSAHAQDGGTAIVNNTSGNQTNIGGNVTGPVMSGTFTGPVTFTSGGTPTPPTSSANDDRQTLIQEKERRLGKLQVTAARYGFSTPPEVVVEIEHLKREIAALERGKAPSAQPTQTPIAPATLPVLAIFAEPAGLTATAWEAEARELRRLLLPFETQFSLREMANITPEDLYQALLTVRPGMLHFQGHGTTNGLVFEDSTGDRYNVSWQALMATLASCESLNCVVLNACDSYVHSQVGAQRFHLITTPGKVSTEATRAFTQGFYAALRAGRSVPVAYRDGCNLLGLKGIAKNEWPALTEAQPA
jgi:hypothetical protein